MASLEGLPKENLLSLKKMATQLKAEQTRLLKESILDRQDMLAHVWQNQNKQTKTTLLSISIPLSSSKAWWWECDY